MNTTDKTLIFAREEKASVIARISGWLFVAVWLGWLAVASGVVV